MTTHSLTLIAGRYRSRKITFPDALNLRPTPNRIRETLFNWLAPHIDGARCLDAFAGSGALGFEALSRGAGHVTFLEQNREVIHSLKQNAKTLGVTESVIARGEAPKQSSEDCFAPAGLAMTNIINTDTLTYQPSTPFDIIFLDPPFNQSLLLPVLNLIMAKGWLNPQGFIYLESNQPLDTLTLPQGLSWHRQKKAASVYYGLVRYLTN